MPTCSAEQLEAIGARIFAAAGVTEPVARRVSASLVLSNLMGVDSHGVIRIPTYLNGIRNGTIDPGARVEIVKDNGVACVMDGHNAFGQIAAAEAMQCAIERARLHAVGVVSLHGVQHIGRLAEWTEMAADAGMFGLVLANGCTQGGLVAPYGSRQRLLGTNPISYAAPRAQSPTLAADFATSAVAEGKVRSARQQHKPIPPEWLMDSTGRSTTNPAALYEGGALRAFGGHKGYALSLMVEILAGILSGTRTAPFYQSMQQGVLMLALDVAYFRPAAEYHEAMDSLCAAVKAAAPAEGFSEVLLPGEVEARCKAERERAGIPVPEGVWEQIGRAAAEFGVQL